jgi:hypothetical protein
MDIGNHIIDGIKYDDPLAIRLFDHKGKTGHVGYHGICLGGLIDGFKSTLVKNKNILTVNLIHSSHMSRPQGVLDDLEVFSHTLGSIIRIIAGIQGIIGRFANTPMTCKNAMNDVFISGE